MNQTSVDSAIARQDPELADAIRHEQERQRLKLEMIASENYCSEAVLEAVGSVLTNKYAEGYPGHRYYGGCEYVDIAEDLARDRAMKLFHADHANVQPHAGAQANMAAYFATLHPGDTAMGLNLSQGGHLTHGLSANFSGRLYNFVAYGVDRETEQFDYDSILSIARECRPKLIVTGATAYPRTIDFVRFREIADATGALLMVDMAHIAGLIAAGLHPSPVPYADIVTSTTHKTMRGPRGAFILCKEEHAQAIDRAVFPGMQGGPLMHVIAGKAIAFGEAMQPEFAVYQRQVMDNARLLAEELQRGGVRIVSGGTDTHLVLADVSVKGLSGRKAERALDRAGITVNKNTIPFDTRSPTVASGIRLGTPALTTRGFGSDEMRQIGRWIIRVLDDADSETTADTVRNEVESMARRFPVPGIPLI